MRSYIFGDTYEARLSPENQPTSIYCARFGVIIKRRIHGAPPPV